MNTTTMGFPDMVIVGMGLRSDSVKRFPNKLSYNEIFKMNSSVWRDVRSWNGGRSGIVGLHEGNRVWRVSPDNLNFPNIMSKTNNILLLLEFISRLNQLKNINLLNHQQ